jgi:microcin C transport system substrate-binding protein
MIKKQLTPIFLIVMLVILCLSSAAYAAPQHAIAMWGKPKYPASFTHFDYVSPTAPKGGTLRQATIGTFDSLNPYTLKGTAAAGLGLTSDTLLVSSGDEPFTAYGLIAESLEVAADRGSVIFNLRPQAKWHDGTPITAEDVVFSYQTITTKAHPFYKAYYREVSGAEALSPRRVKFTFSNAKNRELPLIVGQLPILSKAFWEKRDFEKSSFEPPLENGAYRIDALEAGKWIRYARVQDYWAKDLPVNKGRFNFDTIQFDYYRDVTVAIEAFKAGEFDVREENIAKLWAQSYDGPAFKKGLIKKEEIRHSRPTGMQGFVLNTRRSKFADPQVREALAYAFDFEWANKNMFFNAYTRTWSYFSNSEFAATGMPGRDELALLEPHRTQLPSRLFTRSYAPPITDGSGNNRANLLRARNLLKSAGWVVKEGKLTNAATGEVMTIEFLLSSSSFERVIAPIIKNLAKLGVVARMRTVDGAQYVQRTDTFDFDIVVHVFGQSNSPGNEQLDYWHSTKADVEGSQNIAGIKNPVVDALVERIVKAESKEELTATTRALDRVLLWNFYTIPNWHLRNHRVALWDKFGRPAINPDYDLGLLNWWVDPAKEKRLAIEKKGKN